jgi:cytohesin
MEGFGACFITWMTPPEYLSPRFYDRMVHDLGLSIVRCPIPPEFEPQNDDPDPDNFNWEAFEKESMDSRIAFMREFQRRGVERFVASLWSPPDWLKTNRNHLHGGFLRADMRDEFAEFLAAFAIGARKFWDIDFYSISPQNELHFIEPYNSCVYNPMRLREAVRAVSRKFRREGIETRLMIPEDMGFADRFLWFVRATMEDEETRDFPGFFCCHGGRGGIENWKRLWGGIESYCRQLWMTETGGDRRDWKGALALARGMHNAIVGGHVSAWIFWQFTHLVDGDRPKPGYWPTRHFARYVRPGAVRVSAESDCDDLLVSAYRHEADGTLTAVLINDADEAAEVRLRWPLETELCRLYVSTDGDGCALTDEWEGASEHSFRLPPGSVATVAASPDLAAIEPSAPPESTREPAIAAFAGTPREPLHRAARVADVDTVRRLLDEGWDVNAANVTGLRPLHRAAYHGDLETVEVLLDAGADPDAPENDGGTPLHIAAQLDHPDQVDAMLQAGANPNAANEKGWTTVHLAALGGGADSVARLLEGGGDPNAAARHGWTPLHAAASSPYEGSLAALEALLGAGADPTAVTDDGRTALHAVGANCNTAYRVEHQLTARKARALMDAGADPDTPDSSGRTPLHWAAWMGHTTYSEESRDTVFYTEAVEALLDGGADPNAADEEGRTPLHYALKEGYEPIAAVLVAAGADMDLADNEGLAPRDIAPDFAPKAPAAPEEQVPEAREGASQKGRLGRELREAAREGDVKEVESLLASGADVNDRDFAGGTALHVAAAAGRVALVRRLLEAGADVQSRDSDGFTPLDKAEQNGHQEVTRMLHDAGAK